MNYVLASAFLTAALGCADIDSATKLLPTRNLQVTATGKNVHTVNLAASDHGGSAAAAGKAGLTMEQGSVGAHAAGDPPSLLTAQGSAGGIPVGSCVVAEKRNLPPACSLRADAIIPDGHSRSFSARQSGWQAEQTAACSRGRLVWLPGSCQQANITADNSEVATSASKLPLTLAQLRQFNTDMGLAHEASPKGVPSSYDWSTRPKVDRWNKHPDNYTALTGWGQAFWTRDSTRPQAYLQLRKHQTLVCHGEQRQWSRVQSQLVEGAEFRPDFQGNAAVTTPFFSTVPPESNLVGWSISGAYHFWPSGGRARLPAGPLCGLLVLVQARAVPMSDSHTASPNLLLGMGADYWLSRTAPWDNYKTNAGVGVGRLRLVDETWHWYGFSSASDADLRALHERGYTDLTGK